MASPSKTDSGIKKGFAAKEFRRMLRRMALIQLVLVAISAVIFLGMGGGFSIALCYGGAVTIVSTLWSGWRLKHATESADESALLNMADLYKSVALRFLLVIALLALGMGKFNLNPLAVIIGFCVAQVGYFFGPSTARWGKR